MRYFFHALAILGAPAFAEEPLNCLDHRSTVSVFINDVQKFIAGEADFLRNQVESGAADVFQIEPVARSFTEMAEETTSLMKEYERELFAFCSRQQN